MFDKSGGGYFFDSDDFDSVVKAIEELFLDKIKSVDMGEYARKYIVEHFTSSRVLVDFEKKVKEVINAK